MGKFTQLAIRNVNDASLTPEQTAALQAADAITAKSGTIAVTPTELKADQVPQATPTGSPEGIQEIQGSGLIAQAPEAEGEVRPLTPEESAETYRTQLREEATTPFLDVEESTITLPTAGMAQKGASIAQITEDVARTEQAFDRETGAIVALKGDSPNYATALNKLGLAEIGKSNAFTVRKGTGGSAYLSTLVALARLKGQADLAPEGELAESGKEGNFNRISLANTIAEEFEQMVRPSPTVDPETGEATGAGYESVLSEPEKTGLGDAILIALEQGGLINEGPNNHSYLQKIRAGTSAGKAYEYALTKAGYQHLNNLAPMLEQIGTGLNRPVSAVPTRKGVYRGQLATRQKDITKTPIEGASPITPIMEEAMDVMGSIPNIISEHKLRAAQQMLDDIVAKIQQSKQAVDAEFQKQTGMTIPEMFENQRYDLIPVMNDIEAQIRPQMESSFAKLFDLDYATERKNIAASQAESRKNVKVVWDGDAWIYEKSGNTVYGDAMETLADRYPNPEPGTAAEVKVQFSKREDGISHVKFAKDVQRMALDKARKTLRDAQKQQGKVFYYGATAIGNSSRLMYSQTELNPQANKLARFLVDNPRPSLVTKGGDKDRSFRYVVARAMMADADTVTPKELLNRFNDKQFQQSIAPAAKAIAAGNLEEGLRLAQENKGLAKEWEGTGEWGFVLDALHEWGRYLNTADGAQLATRVKAEADGINNGSSIQGMQFGSTSILRRAGVIYDPNDPEGSVIPEGNMRQYVWTELMAMDPETGERVGVGGIKKEEDREFAASLLETIGERGLIKKFIKIPLMTTIYGKPYDRHGDHAKKFVIDNIDELGIDIDEVPRATSMMTRAISNGLQASLTDALLHQDVIKHTAGWFWNMMNIIPQVEGANGFMIQSGGYDYVNNPDLNNTSTIIQRYFELEDGERVGPKKKTEITSKLRVPSATAAKAPEREGQEPSVGNITRNQLAVSGTHNIDATIAQKTLIRANKEIKDFWGMQIFDAFMGDVNSFEQLIDIGNQEFATVNQEYNMVEKEFEAFRKDIKDFQKTAKEAQDNGEIWNVSNDGTYRGITAFAKRFVNKPGRWKDNSHGSFINLLEKYNFELEETKNGVKVIDGPSAMLPMQVFDLIKFAESNFLSPAVKGEKGAPINQAFQNQLNDIERQRKLFMEKYSELIKFIRQFN